MDLKAKIAHLKAGPYIARYRWSAGKTRVAGRFARLSALRLNILLSGDGLCHYTCAAPVLVGRFGRPRIRMCDKGVLEITGGERRGMLVLATALKSGEDAVPPRLVWSGDVTEDAPQWIARKVLSMGCSPSYEARELLLPATYRLAKDLSRCTPIYSVGLARELGAEWGSEEFDASFSRYLEAMSERTDGGWAVPASLVRSGGMVVVDAKCMTGNGSVLVGMDADRMLSELENLDWRIDARNQMERHAGQGGRRTGGVHGLRDHGTEPEGGQAAGRVLVHSDAAGEDAGEADAT